MTDAKDLSKIDFSKCELPEWQGRRLTAGYDVSRVVLMFVGKTVAFRADVDWVVTGVNGQLLSSIEALRPFCSIIDSFIATELARIAAEEEAANFVPVPWQDVEWLRSTGAACETHDPITGDKIKAYQPDAAFHMLDHYADRRTFPAGYDPTKPRFVEVDGRDVARLDNAGVDTYWSLVGWASNDWTRREQSMLGAGPKEGYRYAIDIHTLKPGVPLHVEPEKPKPDWAPIAHTEVEMLVGRGANVRFRRNEGEVWRFRFSTDHPGAPGYEYQVDRNTVPAGVSIEPEEQVSTINITNPIRSSTAFDRDRFGRETLAAPTQEQIDVHRERILERHDIKPSTKWRPCSKEFALAHPETSKWSGADGRWWPMRNNPVYGWSGLCFQTTSPEPKPEPDRITSYAFMMRLIRSPGPIFAKTPRSPFATGRWFLFDAVNGFRSGAAKDACTVNLDMHLFFAQEWFEVEA